MPKPWAIPNAIPALCPSFTTEFINKIQLGPGDAAPAKQTRASIYQSAKVMV